MVKKKKERLARKTQSDLIDSFSEGSKAFEQLESDFSTILKNLANDEHLESFRKEYERLHAILVKSHQNEVRLIQKCFDLNQQIVANASKLETAQRLSEEDQFAIEKLRREVEKSWDLVEKSIVEDKKNQSEILKLKEELSEAKDVISYYKNSHSGLTDLETYKNRNVILESRLKSAESKVSDLENTIEKMKERSRVTEKTHTDKLRELRRLQHDYQTISLDIDAKDRKANNLMNAFNEEKERSSELAHQIGQLLEANSILQSKLDDKDREIKEKVDQVHHKDREQNALKSELAKYERLYKKITKESDLLMKEKRDVEVETGILRGQKNHINNDLKLVRKEKNKVLKELHRLQEFRAADKEYIQQLEKEKDVFRNELQDYQRKQAAHTTEIKSLELRMLKEKVKQDELKDAIYKEKDKTIVAEASAKKVNENLNKVKKETNALLDESISLRKEREQKAQEQQKLRDQFHALLESKTFADLENSENLRKVNDFKQKLSLQRARYEKVRQDRSVMSLKLRESQNVISEQKQKIYMLTHQIQQLKSEIHSCESRISAINKEKEEIRKEKYSVSSIVTQKEKIIEKLKSEMKTTENENLRLRQLMKEGDISRKFEHIKLTDVIRDRDLLGVQILRKNDIIALLQQKIHHQENIMQKGAHQYRHRVNDIKVLKRKLLMQGMKLNLLKKQKTHINTLLEVIKRLKKERKSSQNKIKALSEQFSTPTNLHGWRLIEAKDEYKFELILKTQWLQKQLISKRQKVSTLQLALEEKDRIIEEQKRCVSTCPPEIQHKLVHYETQIQHQKKVIQSLQSEVAMQRSREKETSVERTKIVGELLSYRKVKG